jgi:hypothetical protein
MILLFAKHGNHTYSFNFRSDADVKRLFRRRGVDWSALVERCRDPTQHVPFFENLMGSTMVAEEGLTVSRVCWATGKRDLEVKGPAAFTLYGYWSTFETAVKARDRAVNETSFGDFHSAVVQGIASIEGYLNYRAERWNTLNPGAQLIDSRQTKISLDEKIDVWIPTMASGGKLDKSRVEWQHFKILRTIRDDRVVHPKVAGQSTSFQTLAEGINMFRTGIAGLLIQLHLLHRERIPAIVIRAAYAPDVELVTDQV